MGAQAVQERGLPDTHVAVAGVAGSDWSSAGCCGSSVLERFWHLHIGLLASVVEVSLPGSFCFVHRAAAVLQPDCGLCAAVGLEHDCANELVTGKLFWQRSAGLNGPGLMCLRGLVYPMQVRGLSFKLFPSQKLQTFKQPVCW